MLRGREDYYHCGILLGNNSDQLYSKNYKNIRYMFFDFNTVYSKKRFRQQNER